MTPNDPALSICFNVPTARRYAEQGRLEDWIHAYLTGGPWANLGLSDGLKLQQRWWRGPLELPLSQLARALGPEPGMEYRVPPEDWETRTRALAEGILAQRHTLLDLPPLIINYDRNNTGGPLSVRDGNHRCGAYKRLGWPTAWVLIWYNSREEYEQDPR